MVESTDVEPTDTAGRGGGGGVSTELHRFIYEGLEHLQILVSASIPGTNPPADTRGDCISPNVMKAVGDQPGCEPGSLNPKAMHLTFSFVLLIEFLVSSSGGCYLCL